MPWHDPHTVPFSRMGVVSLVPSESGVFGILSGDAYVLISESWNLKARLLDLISILNGPENLDVIYELCPEADRQKRAEVLKQESVKRQPVPIAADDALPGIRFWAHAPGALEGAADALDI